MPTLFFLARVGLAFLGMIVLLRFERSTPYEMRVLAPMGGGIVLLAGWYWVDERRGPLLARAEMLAKLVPRLILVPFFVFFLTLIGAFGREFDLESQMRATLGGTLLVLALTPALVRKPDEGADAELSA